MITRLVLVVLVAALGVTLPSRPDCDLWMTSTQRWASGLLADWDTWEPHESDAYCVPMESHLSPSDQERLVRLAHTDIGRDLSEASVADLLKPSGPGQGANSAILASGEERTRPLDLREKETQWVPVGSSENFELAMVLELYRIANETVGELPRETGRPDSGPASRPAVIELTAMQLLPGQVFAPEQPSQGIETRWTLPLLTDVIATDRLRNDAQHVSVSTPAPDVLANEELRSEIRTATAKALPNDVFAPAGQSPEQVGGLDEVDENIVEKVSSHPQPEASRARPIGEIEPLDPDLDIYCKVASPLSPESEREPEDASNLATNHATQPESTSPDAAPELDLRVPSSSQAELDQAVRLTRGAVSAWMSVLKGPGPLTVTTR